MSWKASSARRKSRTTLGVLFACAASTPLVGCTELHCALTTLTTPTNQVRVRYLHLTEGTRELDHLSGGSEEHNCVVLKHDWLYKHTHLAAVASLWFSWDDDTSTATVAAKIESFRTRCRRSCKIVVVLVQRSSPALGPLSSPAKDDDRLNALRKATELDSRSIFSLPQIEAEGESARFDEQSARRVERSLLEHALHYYKDESRNNKKARQLGKSAPPHLVARHHFKRAYFSEVRRDSPNAAKHWQACGAALRELLRLVVSPSTEAERSPVSLGEVKRVAEFVNRKANVAAFTTQRTAEACDAFRRHIRLFRPLTHLPLLTGGRASPSAASLAAAGHVHWGWLCKQYRVRFHVRRVALPLKLLLTTAISLPLHSLSPLAGLRTFPRIRRRCRHSLQLQRCRGPSRRFRSPLSIRRVRILFPSRRFMRARTAQVRTIPCDRSLSNIDQLRRRRRYCWRLRLRSRQRPRCPFPRALPFGCSPHRRRAFSEGRSRAGR